MPPQPSIFDLSTTTALPDGVIYRDEWLDADLAAQLLEEIDRQLWVTAKSGRRHQRYSPVPGENGEPPQEEPRQEPVPGLSVIGEIGRLGLGLSEHGVPGPHTVVVYDYEPGVGFAAAADPNTSSPAVLICVDGTAELQFTQPGSDPITFLSERRSLLLIPPEVRREWTLEMVARATDDSFMVVRRRRVTLTYRPA